MDNTKKFLLRMPQDMFASLSIAAGHNLTSINAEIVERLRESLGGFSTATFYEMSEPVVVTSGGTQVSVARETDFVERPPVFGSPEFEPVVDSGLPSAKLPYDKRPKLHAKPLARTKVCVHRVPPEAFCKICDA
jgi:hypothetical protein